MESMDEAEKKPSLQKGKQLIELIVDCKDGEMFKVFACVCMCSVGVLVNKLTFG